jgi:outer membrane protein
MRSRVLIMLGGVLCVAGLPAIAQETPPIAPKTQTTPLPPTIELPPPPSIPADVPNRPLSAREAARIALRHQPNVTIAQSDITAAQGRTQQARSGLMPHLGVGAGYTRTQTISSQSSGNNNSGGTTGTSGGSSVTVSGYQASGNVTQLLFDFNHTRDQVRQSAELETAATANLTRVQSDLVLQVKQAFYTYTQDLRLVTVNENNVRNQQSHLALADARQKSGLGLPIDVVRAQTAVADAILNLNIARNNASVSRVLLATIMGIDPRTPINANETGEPVVASDDVNALVTSGMRQRPEVLQAQATLRSAQFGVSAAKTTNAPSVSANLGLASRGSDFPPRNDFLSLGATIQWNPFDGGLTAGRVKEARANVEAAQAQLTNAQLGVTSDVSQAYLNLRTAEQRVQTAEIEIANATEGVRLAEGRYAAGVGTFIDVIDAQTALLTADTNRVNAQSAVNQARAALNRAIGAAITP